MSGVFGFVLRETDGREHRLAYDSRRLGWAVNNVRLVRGETKHLGRIVSVPPEGRPFSDDFLRKGKEATRVLAPDENGLLVVDMRRKVILDAQVSGMVASISLASLCCDENANMPVPHRRDAVIKPFPYNLAQKDDRLVAVRFREFLTAGWVEGIMDGEGKTVSAPQIDLAHVTSLVTQRQSEPNASLQLYFALDFRPLTIESFDPFSASAIGRLRKRIQELGFAVSELDERIWQLWLETQCDET